MHVRFGAAIVALLGLLALLPTPALAIANIRDEPQGLADLDARTGTVLPTAAQKQIVSSLGANATWNRFGTPQSLIKYGGFLATGSAATRSQRRSRSSPRTRRSSGSPTRASRTAAPQRLADGRQRRPRRALPADVRRIARDAGRDDHRRRRQRQGRVRVVFLRRRRQRIRRAQRCSPQQAWLIAAASVGYNLSIVEPQRRQDRRRLACLRANGLSDIQRARLTALPTPTDGVRPAYETIVLDVRNSGGAHAYNVFVDAVTGKVLLRHNDVQNLERDPDV